MAKTRKTIGEWAASVFGNSYKTISEKLSAEEHALFVQDATELQAQVLAQEGDDDDEESEETESEVTQQETESTTTRHTVEQRLDALEASLKKEQEASAQLQTKLTETQTKLETAEKTNKKLRQSVNPLAEEDVVTAKQETKYLTKADIEARAAYKASQEDAE